MADILNGIQRRYEFNRAPSLQEVQSAEAVFSAGKFKNIGIGDLKIYNDGVIASGQVKTEDLEEFLKDAFEWFSREFGYELAAHTPLRKTFHSQLEVQLDIDLTQWVSPIKEFTSMFSRYVTNTYGQQFSYGVSGFNLHFDTTGIRLAAPGAYTLERRVNEPYDANLYFSGAPLETDTHIALLEDLEKFAANGR